MLITTRSRQWRPKAAPVSSPYAGQLPCATGVVGAGQIGAGSSHASRATSEPFALDFCPSVAAYCGQGPYNDTLTSGRLGTSLVNERTQITGGGLVCAVAMKAERKEQPRNARSARKAS